MASNDTNVGVHFITTADTRGAKSAASSMGMLEKQAGALGKKMLAAFSVQQVANFLKSSVQAFAEEQRSAALLAQTMKNLFMAQDNASMEQFIQKTEAATGVLDDKLRPAMQTLLRATIDSQKSMELMNLALDISAGTGKDLDAVVSALAKAYLGNTTALAKLGGGLTAADLKSKDFLTIQKKLAAYFKGDAAAAADTFQGKVNRLNVAFDTMKESIGKGIVDALDRMSGGAGGIDKMTSAMKTFGDEVGNSISGLGRLLALVDVGTNKPTTAAQQAKQRDILKNLLRLTPSLQFAASAMDLADYNRSQAAKEAAAMTGSNFGTDLVINQTNIALGKQAALRAANLAAANKEKKAAADKLALEKASAILKNSQKVFDNMAIQLAAAAQNQLTEQDRKRVELKQTQIQLQDAIDNKDTALATKLAASIKTQQEGIQGINGAISKLPTAPDIFGSTLQTIKDVNAQLAIFQKYQFDLFGTYKYIPNPSLPVASFANEGMGSAIQESRIQVHVTVDDNGNLGAKLSNALSNTSANGTGSTLTRVNPLTWGNL